MNFIKSFYCIFAIVLINFNIINGNTLECTEELTNQVIAEKCFTFIQSISSWTRQYRSVYSSDSTVWCHRKVKSVMDSEILKLQQLVNERVKNTGSSHLTSLDEMIAMLQNARSEYIDPNNTSSRTNIGEIAYALRLNDYETALTNYLVLGKFSLSPLINSFYDKELKNALILANFFQILPHIDDTFMGYQLLLNKMIEYHQLYSSLATTIAYRVQSETLSNTNLVLIRNLLPESVKNFPFNSTLKIRNFKYNEALLANNENYNYDANRRITFTYNAPVCTGTNCQWTLTESLNGTFFHLKSINTKEYLNSDANNLASDTKRHSVFQWRKLEDPSEQAKWEIEPIEETNFFKIKNSFWNEYLYAEEQKYAAQGAYRYVYTLSNDRCDYDACKWEFSKF